MLTAGMLHGSRLLEFAGVPITKRFHASLLRNIYCVSMGAVIAASLPYPRMLGCAAEAGDHRDRGRNIDPRSAASACRFVA
ncbi:hypothetical protein AWV79_31275 [Cupriavidus sp. UYMMa02A]|nr:hypothetical protein AWV79_31275 [Cupriavidus sp. UYMMa02A]